MRLLRQRGRAALAIAAALVALTGCTPLLAIDDRAMVLAIALDREACGIQATAQWYSSAPSLMISGQMRPETESACGATASAAVSALRARSNRFVDFGVTNLVLVGRPLAEADPSRALDLVWRDGDLPESAELAVADGEAHSLLSNPGREQGFSLYTRLIQASFTNTGDTPIPLWRFMSRKWGLPGDAWAPLLQSTETGARSVGVAAFSGGRMVAALEGPQANAFSWLTKSGGYSDLDAVPGTSVPVALRVLRSRLNRRCAGRTPALTLTLDARLRQGEGVRLRGRDASGLSRLAAEAAWRDTAGALRTLVDARSDPLGLRTMGCPGTSLGHPVRTVALTVHVHVLPDEREA
jgi:hypothetical protein